jgi:hypothetical protein
MTIIGHGEGLVMVEAPLLSCIMFAKSRSIV